MMISRKIQSTFLQLMKQYPVVTITGPRQAGKTTLARALFPDYTYVNLEAPDIREFAMKDPRSFLAQYDAPAIFDEIQRVPGLLSYLQVKVDEEKKNGMYILTGSHQPQLQAAVAQSLAGRTGLLTLLPLSLEELQEAGIDDDRDACLFHGFMPKLYGNVEIDPITLYRDYFRTYVERDVRQMINVKNVQLFETFVRLLAGRVGQVINLHSLAGDVGVSSTTLKEWLGVLEASYLIFRLPPYYENFGKRLIKSPKLYFTEPGLLAYLLGITTSEQMGRDPLLGHLFENMVVVEALKSLFNRGRDANMYFFRDSQGMEVDLLHVDGGKIYPFEIKAARTYSSSFAANLVKLSELGAPRLERGTVIYSGELEGDGKDVRYAQYKRTAQLLIQISSST